jgi:hypothetical protein
MKIQGYEKIYTVYRNRQRNQKTLTFVILSQMGLTGIDSKCKNRARMQAGVCTALKDSYAL